MFMFEVILGLESNWKVAQQVNGTCCGGSFPLCIFPNQDSNNFVSKIEPVGFQGIVNKGHTSKIASIRIFFKNVKFELFNATKTSFVFSLHLDPCDTPTRVRETCN